MSSAEERMLERRISDLREEISTLKKDLMFVSSERAKSLITDTIVSLKNRLDRTEFKLWKLQKEGVAV